MYLLNGQRVKRLLYRNNAKSMNKKIRPKIALITSKETPLAIDEDDFYLLKSLKSRKVEYNIIPWGAPNMNYFDYSLIRSAWDYYKKPQQFVNWCKITPNLINNFKVVEWNHNKKYLIELSNIANIIPTIIFNKSKDNIMLCDNFNSSKFIIKPCIGLGSIDTFLFDYDSYYDIIKKLKPNTDYLLQPFVSDILRRGEISIIFINGEYSHAVRKTPANGDYRSQPEFGSNVVKFDLTKEYIDSCNKICNFIKNKFGVLKYMRMDFIDSKVPMLIELELIEPCLYFEYCPDAADKLVSSIID